MSGAASGGRYLSKTFTLSNFYLNTNITISMDYHIPDEKHWQKPTGGGDDQRSSI
jgi:hypothetical protein